MEKYGEVPKMFTPAWWGYFWDYYKWHTIIGVAALLLIVFAVSNCAANVSPDVTVAYVNYIYPADYDVSGLEDELSLITEDLNGDGKHAVTFLRLLVADLETGKNVSANVSSMQERVSAEFAAGLSHVFIMTQKQLPNLISRDDGAEMLISLDEYAAGFDDSMLVRDNEGVVRAISMKGNTLLEKYNIPTDDMFITMRNVRYNENKQDDQQRYDEGRKILEYIISASSK